MRYMSLLAKTLKIIGENFLLYIVAFKKYIIGQKQHCAAAQTFVLPRIAQVFARQGKYVLSIRSKLHTAVDIQIVFLSSFSFYSKNHDDR